MSKELQERIKQNKKDYSPHQLAVELAKKQAFVDESTIAQRNQELEAEVKQLRAQVAELERELELTQYAKDRFGQGVAGFVKETDYMAQAQLHHVMKERDELITAIFELHNESAKDIDMLLREHEFLMKPVSDNYSDSLYFFAGLIDRVFGLARGSNMKEVDDAWSTAKHQDSILKLTPGKRISAIHALDKAKLLIRACGHQELVNGAIEQALEIGSNPLVAGANVIMAELHITGKVHINSIMNLPAEFKAKLQTSPNDGTLMQGLQVIHNLMNNDKTLSSHDRFSERRINQFKSWYKAIQEVAQQGSDELITGYIKTFQKHNEKR